MKQKYFTLIEVESITKISCFTLRKMIREKKLKAYRLGNRYLISEEDLQTFIESKKNM